MTDEVKNSMSPRDPFYYEEQYPDRLGVPPASAADDIAFALEELMRKTFEQKIWDFNAKWERERDDPYLNFKNVITMGFMLYEPIKTKFDWMIDGRRMKPQELNGIEDAYEDFMKKMEWEDE